jgi:hypothetical protein
MAMLKQNVGIQPMAMLSISDPRTQGSSFFFEHRRGPEGPQSYIKSKAAVHMTHNK